MSKLSIDLSQVRFGEVFASKLDEYGFGVLGKADQEALMLYAMLQASESLRKADSYGRAEMLRITDQKYRTLIKRAAIWLLSQKAAVWDQVDTQGGHFNNDRGNGISDYYPGAGQIITILRHPFNLHLSTYFYVKREALTEGGGAYRSGKPHPIIQSNWNLREYLTNCKKSYIMSFLPPEITLDNYHSILENRFLYIGVSEKLQPAVDMLSEILGFPPVTVPRRNVSEWSEKIPDGALEEFEEKNLLEMSIYKYAQSHWGNNIDGDQG